MTPSRALGRRRQSGAVHRAETRIPREISFTVGSRGCAESCANRRNYPPVPHRNVIKLEHLLFLFIKITLKPFGIYEDS